MTPEGAEMVVAGAGPAGLVAAHAFARMGVPSLVLERRPNDEGVGAGDARRIVLAERARRLLETLGLWKAVAPHAAPVRQVVVRAPRLGSPLVLDAAEHGLEALGWSLAYGALVRALRESVAATPRVALRFGCRLLAAHEDGQALALRVGGLEGEEILGAELLLVAEGAEADLTALGWSRVPVHDVRDEAWIVPCRARGLASGVAVEAFLGGGTATLLATGADRAVVTLVRPKTRARRESSLPVEERLARLAAGFGLEPGALEPEGEAVTIRVRRGFHPRPTAPRRLAIGPTFHALHPFAAQGLLLSWRDAVLAARFLGGRRARSLGWTEETVLTAFVRSRLREHRALDAFVHRLPPLLSGPGAEFGAPLWRLCSLAPLRVRLGYWGMGYGWGRT